MTQKSLSKVVVWQCVSRFLLAGVSVISAPVFTRLLTTGDYGKLSVYGTWLSLFTIVIGLQTYGSIGIAKITYSVNDYHKYLSSIFGISLLSFLFFFIIGCFFKNKLAVLLEIAPSLVMVLFLQSFFTFSIRFYSANLIQQKKVETDFVISIIVSVLCFALSYLLVKNANEDKVFFRILGEFVPKVGIGFILICVLYIKGKTFFNKEYWTFCLKFCLPLIFHGIGGLILSQSDRVMLDKMIGPEETGVYSVVYQFAFVVEQIWMALNTSWVPFYYEWKKANDTKQLLEKANSYMFNFTVITAGFILCTPEVYKLFFPQVYRSGLNLVPLIALAYYINFLYSFPANFEFYHKKTIYISLATVLSALLNIGLNLWLIPLYAGIGAAVATLVAFLFLFVFHDFVARYVLRDQKYDYSMFFYLKGFLPIFFAVMIYYFCFELMVLRWCCAVILGVMFVVRFVKRRSFF